MAEFKPLDREVLGKAFALMGEILAREKVVGEIHVYGGTAIMLQMSSREATHDVDCVVTSGHGAVMKAMIAVKQKLGLASDWLNEAVSVYASRKESEPDFLPFGQYPSFHRPFLRVMLARPHYVLAMKVEALERNEQRDFDDVERIARELGLSSIDDIIEVRNRYFPEKPLNSEITRALHGIIAKIQETTDVNDFTPPR